MDLPVEIILKKFRREISRKRKFPSVQECMEEFLKYLENSVKYTEKLETQNIQRILYSSFAKISWVIRNAITDNAIKNRKYLPSKTNSLAQHVIRKEIDRLNRITPAPCFDDGQLLTIDRRHQKTISNIAEDVFDFFKISQKTNNQIRRLARLILHRIELSRFKTGIVIAGFGEEEICPTLSACEIDGIINGKLKHSVPEIVDIDREGIGADVRAFAQSEMVERFLQGVDPEYDVYVRERLGATLTELAVAIFGVLGDDDQEANRKADSLSPVIEKMKEDFTTMSEKHKEEEYRRNVLDMVQSMPNEELSTLAESLVDLTSLKRRVSAERETVGGAVDVAVISKWDGFVWIKRKHYFPAELNPRFFRRHFDAPE